MLSQRLFNICWAFVHIEKIFDCDDLSTLRAGEMRAGGDTKVSCRASCIPVSAVCQELIITCVLHEMIVISMNHPWCFCAWTRSGCCFVQISGAASTSFLGNGKWKCSQEQVETVFFSACWLNAIHNVFCCYYCSASCNYSFCRQW